MQMEVRDDPARPIHLRIFIASPGDVAEEREIARTVIQELPSDPQLHDKITTDPVAWDGPGGVMRSAR